LPEGKKNKELKKGEEKNNQAQVSTHLQFAQVNALSKNCIPFLRLKKTLTRNATQKCNSTMTAKFNTDNGYKTRTINDSL
jgi:hypothetical protein